VSRFTDFESVVQRYIEDLFERDDVYDIADWYENTTDDPVTRTTSLHMAQEIAAELDHIAKTHEFTR